MRRLSDQGIHAMVNSWEYEQMQKMTRRRNRFMARAVFAVKIDRISLAVPR
jgi:hypothetical protein